MRRALRSFLLKTHPDFFAARPSERALNEKSLAALNALVDGATASEGSKLSLSGTLRIEMHYRNDQDGDALFRHEELVPRHPSPEWAEEALMRVLVAAGEASPSDASAWSRDGRAREAARSDWKTLAALDAEGLRQAVGETFMRDPPRRKSDAVRHTTASTWDAHVLNLRLNDWFEKRVWALPGVGSLDRASCEQTLRRVASQQPTMTFVPTLIVPPAWKPATLTTAAKGMLVVPVEASEEAIARLFSLVGAELLEGVRRRRQELTSLLAAVDAVVGGAGLESLSLDAPLIREPISGRDALIALAESGVLPLLEDCRVTLVNESSSGGGVGGGVSGGSTVAAATTELVAAVTVQIGPLLSPSLQLEYCINHARLRARVAQALADTTLLCPIVIEEAFYKQSLRQQVTVLATLRAFLLQVLPHAGKEDSGIAVRLGADEIQFQDGVLDLPVDFTVESVKSVLAEKQ